MDLHAALYLGIPILLFAIFAAIVARTYSAKNKVKGEEPKYRMMEDEEPKQQKPKAKEGRDAPRSR